MNTRTPAEVGRLWFENVWDRRELHLIHELLAVDAVGHLEGGQDIVGPDAFVAFQKEFFQAIPDIRLQVVNLLADHDDVCIHWQAHGTHQGSGFGLEATGSPVAFRGVTWFRVQDGQIAEGWDFWNMDGLVKVMAGETVLA